MAKKIHLISLVFVGLLLFGAAKLCLADVQADLAKADAYAANGDYELAEPIYQSIASANPGAGIGLVAQRSLVILYTDWGKPAQADAALDDLVKNFSQNEQVTWEVYGIGERYRKLEKHADALKFYQCVVDNWPQAFVAIHTQIQIALSNIALGNDAAVEAVFEKVTTDFYDDPLAPQVVFSIAGDYLMAWKYGKALPYYKYVADNWPDKDFAVYCQMYVEAIPKPNVKSFY